MNPGSVAAILEDSTVINKLVNIKNSIASVLNTFIPIIDSCQTASIDKDPYVGVGAGSEECDVFVYVNNTMNHGDNIYFTINEGWRPVGGTKPFKGQKYTEGMEVPVEQSNEKLTGSQVSRIIKVKNVCENPMYVRVKIEFKGEDKQGEFPANQYVSLMQSAVDWVQSGDWFYYNKVLESEKETTNLLDGLQFDLDRLMTEHAGSSIDFSVYAQAVQSKHNGTSAEKAQGWPQEAVR